MMFHPTLIFDSIPVALHGFQTSGDDMECLT